MGKSGMGRNSLLRRLGAPLMMAVLVAMLGAGCTHENPASLNLEGNLAMVRLPGGGLGITGQCIPQLVVDFRPNGIMDLMVANSYEFFPQVQNLMPGQKAINGDGPEQLRGDAQTVTIEGAEMTLKVNDASGPFKAQPLPGALLNWYTPFVMQIKPNEAKASRFALIPPNVGEELRKRFAVDGQKYTTMQRVIVNVKVTGRMADGTTVYSNSIDYPVDLCWGCLVSMPVAIEGVGVDLADQYKVCSTKQISAAFTPPCTPGNDEYLPCGFYCFLCDQSQSCDDQFCPTP